MHLVFTVMAAVVVLAGAATAARMVPAVRVAWVLAMAAFAAIFARDAVLHVIENVRRPPVWDFLCFFAYGRAAVLAHDVYLPASLHAVATGFAFTPDFSREVLDVGFIYPPTTIALVAPLGYFATPEAALVAWYAIVLGGLALFAVLVWRAAFRELGIAGLLAAATLVLAFGPVAQTIAFTQTIGLVAAGLLGFALDRHPGRRGMWLALAICAKPVAAVVVLIPLIRRAWPTLAALAATLVAAVALAIPYVGIAGIARYVTDGPTARYPFSAWVETVNQSLLATMLRAAHAPGPQIPHAIALAFAAIALGLIAACAFVAYACDDDVAIAFAIVTGLLVYPGTIAFYATLMLVALALLWRRRNSVPGGSAGIVAFAAAAYFLGVPGQTFVMAAAGWIALAYVAFARKKISAVPVLDGVAAAG